VEATATVSYTRSHGKRLTYAIAATTLGNYTVLLDGQVVKTMAIGDHYGAPRYGSKKLQDEAIEAAKAAIERLMTDEG
jgi:hypothetical protein